MTSTSYARVKSTLIGLSAVAVAICGTPSAGVAAETSFDVMKATLSEPNQKAPEVSTEELRKILSDKSAKVLDARPHLEYSISHIPGAENVAPKPGVPMSVYVSDVAEIGRMLGERKDAAIVLYCNGPFCGKSKRLAEELIGAGYTNIRRYQLGIPVWRALVGVTQIEPDGIRYVREGDKTAMWFDARSAEEFKTGSVPGARHLPKSEVVAAKDDRRLPMEDHNTRIIVFGKDAGQAREAAEEIAKNAFHNVSFYAGSITELKLAQK
jgi:rhodanese-related sulfurtransferase